MFKKLPEAISKTIKPLGYESDAPVETGAKVIVKKSKEELLAEGDYIPYEFVKDDDNNIIYCDDQTIFTNSKLDSINFYFDENGIKVGTTASKNQLKLFEEVANRSVDPREDNMLKITNDARKMTITNGW